MFLGTRLPVRHVLRPRQDRARQTDYNASTRSPLREQRGLQRWGFRGSIAWLSDSLSTLHLVMKDSLTAAGRLCRAGFDPQGSDEGFQICFPHIILPSQAFMAQYRYPLPGDSEDAEEACGCAVRRENTRRRPAVLYPDRLSQK